MKILEVKDRSPELIASLVKVWEGSVRATHKFLSEPEIEKIKEYVPDAMMGVAHLSYKRIFGYMEAAHAPIYAASRIL